MCSVCGCEHGEARMHVLPADGPAEHHHHHDGPADHRAERAVTLASGPSESGERAAELASDPTESAELVVVEKNILAKNDAIAAHNRRHFAAHGVLALNLVSSPGAGKTMLLVALLERLKELCSLAVIEGDQETTADADRIRATGVPAVQVNTGKGCHLDAAMVDDAFHALHITDGVLFIENVGNLVCPAGFDLGEAHKVVIASVTEGEDKPLKYPNMFAAATLMLVSKTDLLPHLDFDVDALIRNARAVNPSIAVLKVSARTGDGLDRLVDWLRAARALQLAAE